MRNLRFYLILICFVFLNCETKVSRETKDGVLYVKNPEHGLWQDRKENPIVFELEKTFGVENEPDEEMFSTISDVFTDVYNNVYIFDRRENRFVSYNAEGEFVWITGRQGGGPGEFQGVSGVVFDGSKYFYVGNQSGNRIDKFDLNGEYIKSYNLSNTGIGLNSLIGFIPDNILVFKNSKAGKYGVQLSFLDLGDLLQAKPEIYIEEDIGVKIPEDFFLNIDVEIRDTEVVLGSLYTYKLSYYNLDGALKKVITRDFDKIMRPAFSSVENSVPMVRYGGVIPPLKLSNEIEICFLYWATNVDDPDAYLTLAVKPELIFRHALDFYNSQGELLYSIYGDGIISSEIGGPIHIDSAGKLYTVIIDPFPQVKRFNVIIKP